MPPKRRVTRKKKSPIEQKLHADGKRGWQFSDAKAAAYAAIVEGEIPAEEASDEDQADLEICFHCRPEIASYGGRNKWKSRLNDLRAQIDTAKKRADDDQEAFNIYVKNHPKHTICAKGNYPEWDRHAAQKQLKEDLEEYMQDEEKFPMDLWEREDREVYRMFPQQVFRDHIYQELQTDKFLKPLKSAPHKYGNKWQEFMTTRKDDNEKSNESERSRI